MNATNATIDIDLRLQSLTLLYNNKIEYLVVFGCGLLALFTNPLIIWTIWRQKTLHTGCFLIIAQLALADFFVGLSYTISMMKRFIRMQYELGEVISQLQCSFEMAFNYFSESASLYLALAVGFERILAAARPLHYGTNEWKIARITSTVAWLIPTLDCCSMLIVMVLNAANFVTVCTASYAVTASFFSVQQIEKNCIAIAIIVTYCLTLLTISLQLKAAKKRNSRSLTEMKKHLQLKMVRLLVALMVLYLALQVTTRIGLLFISRLPQEQRLKIGPPIRALIVLNSGIHLFVYISSSALRKSKYEANISSKPHLKEQSYVHKT